MTRQGIVSSWVILAMLGAGSAAAQETSPVIVERTPAPTAESQPRRLVSPAVAAQLSAAIPKFEPASTKPETPTPDLRESDKPRNTILRLPSYIVREEKPILFKERELLTPKGRLDLALRKHPGMRFGSFWIFRNDGWALAMLAEEERLERQREMSDLLSLLTVADQKQMKPKVDEAFMRHIESR